VLYTYSIKLFIDFNTMPSTVASHWYRARIIGQMPVALLWCRKQNYPLSYVYLHISSKFCERETRLKTIEIFMFY